MEFYHYSPSVTFVVQSPPQPFFLDVTQRYPKKDFFFGGGGGGRCVTSQKTAAEETIWAPDDGIILRNFKLLQNDPGTGRIFSQPPSISFKRDKNRYLFSQKCFKQVIKSELLNAHANDAKHLLSFVTLRKYRAPSDPSRSLIISPVPQPMSSTACDLCKKLYIGETGRPLGDRFREHLRDLEKDDKNAFKPVARYFNLPNHSKQHTAVCGLSLHQGSTESRKTLEQKFIFQIDTLNPHGINERFSFN